MMKKKRPIFKFQPFSRKQRKIFTWWADSSPVKDAAGIIADGAIRSGKTVSMSLSFVMWSMAQYDSQNFIMAGKTISSFKRNVLQNLKLMLTSPRVSLGISCFRRFPEHAGSQPEWKNKLFFHLWRQGRRLPRPGTGYYGSRRLFDEVALMPESFVNQATARCSVEGSTWWFNCNPAGPTHWFKVNWIDKRKKKRLLYLHFTMEDNLSLSEKIKERYLQYVCRCFLPAVHQGPVGGGRGSDLYDVHQCQFV